MIIALEEHYFDPDWNNALDTRHHAVRTPSPLIKRMEDLGAQRIREMDEAGIDLQVISHGPPGSQGLREDVAVAWSKSANDRLHAAIQVNPSRFAGFASLPTAHPLAAADELERTVNRLGFKGGMLHSLYEGPVLDDKRYWPIFERAAALDVPLYIHPADPNPAVMKAYYGDYAKSHPMFIRAAWGFTFEAGTQAMRLVLSGLFDAHPGVKIILGHLGETLPFLVWRIDQALKRPGQKSLSFRDIFCGNYYITTSGNFSNPALLCCVMEMGIDRILFAIDWPFVPNPPGTRWMETVPLCDEDKVKLLSGNAQKLFRL